MSTNTQGMDAGAQVFPRLATQPASSPAANAIATLLVVTAVAVLVTQGAFAGTDSTFNGAANQISDWLEGSVGRLVTIVSVGAALLGMALKFDWRMIGGAVGVGLTASAGPSIATSMASAIF